MNLNCSGKMVMNLCGYYFCCLILSGILHGDYGVVGEEIISTNGPDEAVSYYLLAILHNQYVINLLRRAF